MKTVELKNKLSNGEYSEKLAYMYACDKTKQKNMLTDTLRLSTVLKRTLAKLTS